jgi:DNA-binding NarL/FixJ family response regulator
MHDVTLLVRASHESIREVVKYAVTQAGFRVADEYRPEVVQVLLDNPLLWAFEVLERIPKERLVYTVVSTVGSHPVYLDCLASYKPSGVFISTDGRSALAAIYAASVGSTSYQMASGLTKTELRIVRLLLKGRDPEAIACHAHIKRDTVNTHISNILSKLGYGDRTQLVAKVLGYCPD